jgi:hypothetical protein
MTSWSDAERTGALANAGMFLRKMARHRFDKWSVDMDASFRAEIAGLSVEIDRRRTPHKLVFSLEGRSDVPPCRVSATKFASPREVLEFARAWVSLQRPGAADD